MRTESVQKKGASCQCVIGIRSCVMSSSPAQDMSGQAAHDSAQTESAALNVSINASTHLVYKSNLQNLRLRFPNRPLLAICS